MKAVTTRSGHRSGEVSAPTPEAAEDPVIKGVESETAPGTSPVEPSPRESVREPVRPYRPPIPYPARLRKEKEEGQYQRFLDMLRQLHVNIPFV